MHELQLVAGGWLEWLCPNVAPKCNWQNTLALAPLLIHAGRLKITIWTRSH